MHRTALHCTALHYTALHSTALHCICIMTRGGIYGEILPEHEGNPEGGARWISRGLRLYFTVYPNLSHNTDILNF